tara:strand:- start:327 stop:752 length:426 start_codon:yes stop_codon:yes gene_type:complete
MSWKKRRQWANSSPDPDFAPWFNLFTVISLVITIFGLPLIKLPAIGGLIGLLFIVSLVSTPWCILMGLASGTWELGFPSFREDTPEEINQKENNYDLNTRDYDQHLRRLQKFKCSRYKQTLYYLGPRGGVYYYSYGTKYYC